mmetsp:Transcript_122977/g.309486  ORF Transcript_122977/g.309486 Transcript_122977/m.309486 type:complete len:323 (-) Transcript_122977:221-1189(-)
MAHQVGGQLQFDENVEYQACGLDVDSSFVPASAIVESSTHYQDEDLILTPERLAFLCHFGSSSSSYSSSSSSRHDRRDMLLWCGSREPTRMETLTDQFRHRKILYFPTPVKFSRWLFQQRRGAVTPWSVLVVGWREAKPCMLAIRAALSGDSSQLRPDARRAQLRAPAGIACGARSGGGQWADGDRGGRGHPISIAVGTMIVALDKLQQEPRVLSWIRFELSSLHGFRLFVTSDIQRVVEAALLALPWGSREVSGSREDEGASHNFRPFASISPFEPRARGRGRERLGSGTSSSSNSGGSTWPPQQQQQQEQQQQQPPLPQP